jgi:hypothetical protein
MGTTEAIRTAEAMRTAEAIRASAAAAIPARHPYIMPDVVTPIRAAMGLIRNLPSVSPSQYPLTA